MKELYIIGGPMGVGKTAACRKLQNKLDSSVFLDGDWCWDMRPFTVNAETRAMVIDNICHTLNNFIHCSEYESIIFCWVMHQADIISSILSRINTGLCRIRLISLVCSEAELEKRITKDIELGLRGEDALERSLSYLPIYDKLDTVKLDTTSLTPDECAERIMAVKPFIKGAVIETERLYLRQMSQSDFDDIALILKDPDTMYAYEHGFSDEEVSDWINRQLMRYDKYGFGLWAAIEKASGRLIGQCGLTMQDAGGKEVLEIGYLFNKAYWHRGFAAEAAAACKKYAFDILGADEVCSIIRSSNIASQRVAERNGMKMVSSFVKHYYGIDMPHLVFSVRRG